MIHHFDTCWPILTHLLGKFSSLILIESMDLNTCSSFGVCTGRTVSRHLAGHVLETPAWNAVKQTMSPFWLVVSTPPKNISQLRWSFPIYGKIKHVPNHQLDGVQILSVRFQLYSFSTSSFSSGLIFQTWIPTKTPQGLFLHVPTEAARRYLIQPPHRCRMNPLRRKDHLLPRTWAENRTDSQQISQGDRLTLENYGKSWALHLQHSSAKFRYRFCHITSYMLRGFPWISPFWRGPDSLLKKCWQQWCPRYFRIFEGEGLRTCFSFTTHLGQDWVAWVDDGSPQPWIVSWFWLFCQSGPSICNPSSLPLLSHQLLFPMLLQAKAATLNQTPGVCFGSARGFHPPPLPAALSPKRISYATSLEVEVHLMTLSWGSPMVSHALP